MKGGLVTNQAHLEKVVRQIFPNEEIIPNARDEAKIKNKLSDHFFEVDLWVPSLNLGFEFQDDYHFITTWYYHRARDCISMRDTLKRETVLRNGITLVQIPCWWDGSINSLQATLLFERPDLSSHFTSEAFPFSAFQPSPPSMSSSPPSLSPLSPSPHSLNSLSSSYPIPPNPSLKFFSAWRVPGVGELMSPSFSTSLDEFSENISPLNPWWLGEKYDGIRACWNPSDKILYSRIGRDTNLPNQFIRQMPSIFFECEFWFGRGSFSDAVQIYATNRPNLQNLRLIAFDKPDPESHKLYFEKRYGQLVNSLPSEHPFIILAMRMLCKNAHFLAQKIKTIINDGGEGVILRKAKSKYICGRSDFLWKFKTQREDTEALVVREEDDSYLLLQLPNGITFRAPPFTPKPKKGEVVTFLFDNFTKNAHNSVPTNPQIYRVRPDLEWIDVLREFHAQQRHKESPDATPVSPAASLNPKTRKNAKMFLEAFARSKNLDPLLASTWYAISEDLRKQKEMKGIVAQYGDYLKALRTFFPQINFQDSKFISLPKNYWGVVSNRYNYLLKYAEKKGLDPLKAQTWYSLSLDEALQEKEVNAVISYYDHSFRKALLHLFPNIGLDSNKLAPLAENPFGKKFQKKAMVQLACAKGFDPLVASNWYSVEKHSFVDIPFIARIYQGNFVTALLTIFPDIGLERKKFEHTKKEYGLIQQRAFFDDFATENAFDPRKAENWYNVEKDAILAKKNGHAILSLYNKSLANALMAVYPDIELHRNLFTTRAKKHKELFDKYAKENAFDPLVPDNWYTVTKGSILKFEEAKLILGYHDNLATALIYVYPNIGLNPGKFEGKKTGIFWASAGERRKFFDSIARALNLDPLLPATWYSLKPSVITSHKDGIAVLKYHNMNVRQALMELYPNIGLHKSRFVFL
eukprot:Phypoly_transcript_02278.p1 GENE.Phypoly_transcript_02278~~Phypoly_transcript_02278.p1  ORF type:complete len:919 (+),score=129.98 Phypoly_transcript_02278:81-2837(+)